MIRNFVLFREEILSKTIMNEDLEATTIVSSVPAKKNTLSEALEKIKTQATKHSKHQRNLTFRTVASTPKSRAPENGLSSEFSPVGRERIDVT